MIFFEILMDLADTFQLLTSAFLQGADADDLTRVFETESKLLDAWADSPAEVTTDDWRDHLGCREYADDFGDTCIPRLTIELDIKRPLWIFSKMNWSALTMTGKKLWQSTSFRARNQSFMPLLPIASEPARARAFNCLSLLTGYPQSVIR